MNYLELVNRFWAKDAENHFSANETALYFYLLNMCHSARWQNPFGLSNNVAIAKFGWGKASFVRARNRLKDAGLIDFRAGIGRGNIYRYLICDDRNPENIASEKSIQPDIFSREGVRKVAQPKTLCGQFLEKENEKDVQTNIFSQTAPEKGVQTDSFSIAFFGKQYEKGVQTETFLKQFSEKGIKKGTQTAPFYSPKLKQNQGFQKRLNIKKTNHLYNISLFKCKDNIEEDNTKTSEKQNFEKSDDMDKNTDLANEKKEKEKSSAQKEKEVLALYLTVCTSFPKLIQLTTGRKEKILRRLSEMGGMKIMEQVLRKMEASDFLKGNNKFGWKASFDWVIKNSDNWMKILEGNYDNRIVQQGIFKPANDARFMGMLQTDINKF